MKVRLTKKLAECLNGIDLSSANAGEVLDLDERQAALLILEGWAAREGEPLAEADDRPRRAKLRSVN